MFVFSMSEVREDGGWLERRLQGAPSVGMVVKSGRFVLTSRCIQRWRGRAFFFKFAIATKKLNLSYVTAEPRSANKLPPWAFLSHQKKRKKRPPMCVIPRPLRGRMRACVRCVRA